MIALAVLVLRIPARSVGEDLNRTGESPGQYDGEQA
jgi:hypothetical protein